MAKTNIQAFSGEVEVASNLQVGTANLFVDITTGKVGIGKTNPTQLLDIVGNVAANVNTLFVDTVTSRVGIGTSNPSTNFDVNGNVNIGSTLTVSGFRITAAAAAEDDLQAITNAGADTTNQIHITNATRAISSSTGALRVGDSGAPGGIGVVGNVYVGDTVTTQDLSVNNVISDFAVNTNDLFVDISESKVGILTTQPHAELHVVGNVYASSNLTVDTDTFHVDAENDRVGVNTKNPEASLHLVGNAFVSSNLTVDTDTFHVDAENDRVGINTKNPEASLHLVGNAFVSSDLTVPFVTGLGYLATRTHTFIPDGNDQKYFLGWTSEEGMEIEINDTGNSHGSTQRFYITYSYNAIPYVSSADVSNDKEYNFYYTKKNERLYIWFNGTRTAAGNNVTYTIRMKTLKNAINLTEPGVAEIYESTVIGKNAAAAFPAPMLFKRQGKVGIGTDNPSGALHIVSENVYLQSGVVSPCTWQILPQTGNTTKLFRIYDQDNTTDRIVIDSDGKVGVGTYIPNFTLDVWGSRNYDGTTALRVLNPAANYGRNQIHLVGRYENVNDAWSAEAPRNAIMFKTQSVYNGTITNRWTIQSFVNGSNNDLGFLHQTSDTPKIVFRGANGNVGIGTDVPHAKLHIVGASGDTTSSSGRYFYGTSEVFNSTDVDYGSVSIYATNSIITNNFLGTHGGAITASDTRIKKNIVDADDAECLEVLRLLKPKKYQYKDEFKRGQEPVWGFIAQEVRETLPYATQLRKDVLPNIYELANVSDSNVITFTNFNTSNLESNATTLIRTTGIDGKDHDIHLAEVIDDHTIRVEEDLSAWTGSVDETGNVIAEITTTTLSPEEYETLEDKSGYVANITGYQNANVVVSIEEYNALEDTTGYEEIVQDYTKTTTTYPGTQLFIYGQEVDDFVFLKKEAIWTVATAALQEVDRQLQAEKAKVASLEARIAALESA